MRRIQNSERKKKQKNESICQSSIHHGDEIDIETEQKLRSLSNIQ